ncbi:hypothetical protein BJ912DRAFT_934575 [Pholiota molesta]|nr:hypothetical protein BJ912DRAFT_934575 [Pholiota molesta]
MSALIPTSSILKLALAGGLLAFRPGDRGPMGKEQKAGVALLAGAAGFAVAPTIYQLAHGLRGPATVPAKVDLVHLRPARPKATGTRRPAGEPTKTKTWGPEAGAGGKPRNAVFAIAVCVLVAGGGAAMVLGQRSAASAAGEDGEELDDVEDVPAGGEDAASGSGGDSSAPGDGEDAASGSGGDSSAPGDAPDDPSGVGDESDTVSNDAHACNGDVGASGSDDGNKGCGVYGLDWKALFIALAVVAAFKKYKALRAMNYPPAQVTSKVQEYSSAYLRDGANAGLLATASCAAFASTKHSAISSQFVDLATVVDDKEKQLALIYDIAMPRISAFPGQVGMCAGECVPSVKAAEMPWEWDDDRENQPPVALRFALSPEEALDQIIAAGSGSPVEEEPAKSAWDGAFVKRTLVVVLVAVVAYLFLTIDRLNAAIEDIDEVNRQAVKMEQAPCDIEEEEIYYDAPSESTDADTEIDTPADIASNASITGEEVADEELTVEEPEQTILADIVAEVNVRKRSVSSPAIFTGPIEEVALIEFISPSKTFPDHMPDIAPAPPAVEDPASASIAPPDIEIAPPTPTVQEPKEVFQETQEVFAIPVVGEERPRRRVRGGRRSHTRTGHGRGNGQAGGSSTFI